MKYSKLFFLLTLILILSIPFTLFSATYRIVTYNILNFNITSMPSPGPNLDKVLALRNIMNSIDADIVVVQEMISESAANFFRTDILNNTTPGEYNMTPFVNGLDTDSALYYKSTVTYIGYNYYYDPINSPRYMMEYTLSVEGQEFKVYSIHLKASEGSDNETKRRLDAELLRRTVLNELSENYHFFICGDYNIYSSSEPAYQEFIMDQSSIPGENNNGRCQDVITITWVPSDIPLYITQSTTDLDDRFDLILISYGLTNSSYLDYIPGSYTVFGNDGQHYNKSIIDPPPIANANDLLNASDHLPLYIEFQNLSSVDDYFLY